METNSTNNSTAAIWEVCIATPFGAHQLFGPVTKAEADRFWSDVQGRYEARVFTRTIVGEGR